MSRRVAVEAMEQGDQLCLLMLDIDYFKKFNDKHGQVHLARPGRLPRQGRGQEIGIRFLKRTSKIK